MLRNSEFRKGLYLFLGLGSLLTLLSFLYGGSLGCFVLLSQLLAIGIYVFTEKQRYTRLQSMIEALDRLLLHESPLSIEDYREGELSLLADQVQKLTLKLTEAKKALEQDKRFLANSLADISHQLRTPLTAMHLTLSLLQNSETEADRRRQLLRDFRSLLHRTQWLVEALLKLSKLDARTVQFHKESIPLDELLRNAIAPFAISMELQEQRLSVDCDEGEVLCDPVWTGEAIGNVLKNAIEHSPPGGEIRIRGKTTALFAEITVEDEGGGFPQEELPHIFERFYRGSKTDPKSCGIGLSLAQSILAAQHGSIRGENKGKGARFTLKLYKQFI